MRAGDLSVCQIHQHDFMLAVAAMQHGREASIR